VTVNEQPSMHPGSAASRAVTAASGDLLAAIRGGLVVSCQAPEGDTLRNPEIMAAMAVSVAGVGAVGIRANGLSDVREIRARVGLPLIGLWKDGSAGVYITPTAEHAVAVARAGADVVAVDGTLRPRPDGRTLADSIAAVHSEGRLLMADVSTVDDGLAAQDAGADMVSTTLSGYTADSPSTDEPDLDLVAALVGRLRIPVVAEGRIRTPAQASRALQLGAWAVVVGTAITAPAWIASQFVRELAAVQALSN
jgi:N-acylglucosamine-6-phosphate 2-epimerase